MSQSSAPLTPDAIGNHWSLRLAPAWARPYARLMRLERPIGWYLLVWPCFFSSLAASTAADLGPQWQHLTMFVIGAIIMRGAGCTLNDIVDRDIDGKVARTAMRPIPAGEVSVRNALFLLVGLLLAGLCVLLTFNWFTVFVGASSLFLVAIYPFMKRITNWPQLVLGLVFSWGALVGWAAVEGSLSAPAILIYVGCVAWTVGYDTVYACQDIDDDTLLGIGSTPQAVGDFAPHLVAGTYALFVLCFAVALYLAGASWLSYVGLAAAAGHLGVQVQKFDAANPQASLRIFKSNGPLGLVLSLALLADVLL
ncbi:MAG: 4-hydroxybenzoate octaprenyltransferase [Pseudomonadota bacterium]